MPIMANVLMNSPTRFVIFDGFSCPQNQDNRVAYFFCINSRVVKFQKQAKFNVINYSCGNFEVLCSCSCDVSFFNDRRKTRKLVNYNFRVKSIEDGLVCQLGESPSFEQIGSSHDYPLASIGGNMKLYYLEERNEAALSKRIIGLSRANKCRSVLQLFRSMEFAGLKPDLHACNSLLACLSRNDMVDDLLRVFAVMRRNMIISGHSCSLILKAVANNYGGDKALQMFDEWENNGDYFDAIVYNTMISICGKENKWVEMERIWNAMKENGSTGTAITYRILVCTFVRCGQYEIAINAYAEILQNGLEPGYDAMHAIIGAYSKEEKWYLAFNVFQTMLSCGLKPNLIACNALINSLGRAGKLKEAFKVYKHIKYLEHTPDSYTWNALLGAFYRANQYANALHFFDIIQKEWSVKPNLQLYNSALMCCQRLGFWDKALQILWIMENSEISVSIASYNIVIGACEVARKPKIALQVYEHMLHKQCTPDNFTHLSLIRSCIWGDLWDDVENILEKELTPNVSLYNAAIQGMCLKGRSESGKRLYVRMRDMGLIPDGKTRALMLQFMHQNST